MFRNLVVKAFVKATNPLVKKLDSNSQYESLVRKSILDFLNFNGKLQNLFITSSSTTQIPDERIYLYIRYLCGIEDIDKGGAEKRIKEAKEIVSNKELFESKCRIAFNPISKDLLDSALNTIAEKYSKAKVSYDNTLHLMNSASILICQREQGDSQREACLRGLYKCHSYLISNPNTANNLIDRLDVLFEGKLENTLLKVDKSASSSIEAKQILEDFDQKPDVMEFYKRIFVYYLTTEQQFSTQQANLKADSVFAQLRAALPVDISFRFYVSELFGNLTPASYNQYRKFFL